MPQVQAVNRRALVMTGAVSNLLERCRVGDFCFEYESQSCEQPTRTHLVLYLLVPGEGREPELVKLYMQRSHTRWDEPGDVIAWDGNNKGPTLTGAIQTQHWVGLFEFGKLWTELVEGTDARDSR